MDVDPGARAGVGRAQHLRQRTDPRAGADIVHQGPRGCAARGRPWRRVDEGAR